MPQNIFIEMSINDIQTSKKNFFIPDYQRGYRWTVRQVEELLDDIWDFKGKFGENKDKFYCLQPVVVKEFSDELKAEKKLQGVWYEVIDGQQRLTTIKLILNYINSKLPSPSQVYDVSYQTRPGSQQYLNNINSEQSSENIDNYHLYNAHDAIQKWVDSKGDINLFVSEFYPVILKRVKFIWYEIKYKADPIEIFIRLNSGKIPLTSSELVKALFLNSDNFIKGDSDRVYLKQCIPSSNYILI